MVLFGWLGSGCWELCWVVGVDIGWMGSFQFLVLGTITPLRQRDPKQHFYQCPLGGCRLMIMMRMMMMMRLRGRG